MRIGMIDVDSHNYPNIALMKLSAYHKSKGDTVDWWFGWDKYDVIYKSKVFSDTYSEDEPDPVNCDLLIKGGSGYAMQTVAGLELYDKEKDKDLPTEVEHCFPDYGLYPELTKDTAYGRLTKGCPKKCPWCHCHKMEGTQTNQIAEIEEWWSGQRQITLMDSNILAARNREELLVKLQQTKSWINFNQGLDIQRCDADVFEILNKSKIKTYHFAWDDPAIDLTEEFAFADEKIRIKNIASRMVYVLTNFGGSGLEDALERIMILKSLRFDPYLMIYDKKSAPHEIRDLQRWCNNKILFNSCEFEEYKKGRRK